MNSNEHSKVPLWVWLSCFPFLGSLSIVYAGVKINNNRWIMLGFGFFISVFLIVDSIEKSTKSSSSLLMIHWTAQMATAFCLRQKYWEKLGGDAKSCSNFLSPLSQPNSNIAQVSRATIEDSSKIDINKCSKNNLVHKLGLPIVYANDIDLLRTEGYTFTYLEELSDLVGIPTEYLEEISPLISFNYNSNTEVKYSWKRVNIYSLTELIATGLSNQAAIQIIQEREKNGEYKSLLEIKKRTGLPFDSYRQLVYHS